MRKSLFSLITVVLILFGCSSDEKYSGRLETFQLDRVSLEEGPFYDAQQADLNYILEMDVDRLLAPFLIDAGFEPLKPGYGNWEGTGLNGHIGGHYLSALAMMYQSTGEEELINRLNYMLEWLDKCQKANGNGYVGGIPNGKEIWNEVSNGNIKAENFSLNGGWVPLYNIHKTFAGLRDAYLYTGSELALEIWKGLSDWWLEMTSELSGEQIQEMLISEHGGLNEVFADIYVITENQQYLEMAQKLSHKLILNPLLAGEDKLTGLHANTQIPKVVGFQKISAAINQDSLNPASDFFWKTVTDNRTVSFGGNSVKEHFNPVDDFSEMLVSPQGPETCNTYNMMRLSKEMFLASENTNYLDFYERAQFNHILSSQNPDGGFVYFTPLRPNHYRVYSSPHTSMWCCVGSGLENHAKYGELIYAHKGKELWINLFISSELNWEEEKIRVVQEAELWTEQRSTIMLNIKKPRKMAIKVRIPNWISEDGIVLLVNGQSHEFDIENNYAKIERFWYDGDQLIAEFNMNLYTESLPDGSSWQSFLYGPYVLAAPTSRRNLKGIRADDGRMSHIASGEFFPMEETPVLIRDSDESIEPLIKDGSTFKFNLEVRPSRYEEITFQPFYQIHESRYVMYLPVLHSGELQDWKNQLTQKDSSGE